MKRITYRPHTAPREIPTYGLTPGKVIDALQRVSPRKNVLTKKHIPALEQLITEVVSTAPSEDETVTVWEHLIELIHRHGEIEIGTDE